MQSETFNLVKLEADEGKVFDWADLSEHIHTVIDEETGEEREEQEHLYVKTIFLAATDSADNYVEVDAPVEDEEDEN